MGLPVGYNDLWFTPDGDFLLSDSGDLRDTRTASLNDELASVRQFIIHRLLAEENGWPLSPKTGGGLERFIGKPINEETANNMQQVVKNVLTFDALLAPSDVTVRVLPLTEGLMAVMIWVKGASEGAVVSFAYDIQQGSIIRVR